MHRESEIVFHYKKEVKTDSIHQILENHKMEPT